MKKLATVFLFANLINANVYALDDKVIATYSGGDIKESEVINQFRAVLDMQPEHKGKSFADLDANTKEALVKGYINLKLIDQEVEKQGIRKSKEFQDKLKAVEQQMAQQELIERYLKKTLTDKMVEEEYNKYIASIKGQEEIKTSHILVDTEEKAKEIKKKLNKGSEFAKLAAEFSKDTGSKVNGGELGYAMKGQLVPEYEAKAFSMKKDEISDPIKSQFGWHIIKLIDKRPVTVPAKDQVLPSIKNKLSRDIIEQYFKEMSDNAKIQLKLQ